MPINEEIIELGQNQIPSLSYEELIKIDNVLAYPTILGSSIRGGEAIFGSGNSTLKFNGVDGLWLGNATFASAPFSVSIAGALVASSLTITGGTIKYGKTSFTDSTNAGYWIGSSGLYFGSAANTNYIKYTIADGSFAINGAITTNTGSSINGTYLSSLSVATGALANLAVTAAKIDNATITTTQISGTAGITGTQIANATITTTQISGTAGITGSQIANATITTTQISGTAAITGSQIASATITSSNISGTAGITGGQIASATITSSNISGTAGITGGQIASATITTTNISATAGITGGQIANTTIVAGNITNLTITAAQIANLTITSGKVNTALMSYGHNIVFSFASDVQVNWASGTLTTSDGTAYTISAGNTGTMSAKNYIYLDTAVSVTVLQITTTFGTAVGDGKMLVAVAQNNTTEAVFQVFNGIGGTNLAGGNIVAGSITANEIAATTITASNIAANTITSSQLTTGAFVTATANISDAIITNAKISDLAVSKLTAGTITSKAITLAISAGTGDTYIAAGKTDFTNVQTGLILGMDDSDSDLAKFYIGNSTDYFNWTGSTISILCSAADAITIDYGSNVLLKEGGSIKFTSVTTPTACTATLIATETGNVNNGTHSYKVTYVNATGETELGAISNVVTVDDTHKQVQLSSIPTSSSSSATQRKIYRTKAGGTSYYLLTTLNNNTTVLYTDNTADASLTGNIANGKINNTFGKIIIDDVICGQIGSSNILIGPGTDSTSAEVMYNNVAIGANALHSATTGWQNIAIGGTSLYANTTGNNNTAVGMTAMNSNTEGYSNTGIGGSSLLATTTGDNNTAIGYKSGQSNQTGDSNVFIGAYAGGYETSSSTFYVDNQDRSNTAGDKAKAILFGVMAATAATQKLTINALLNQSVSKTPASAAAAGTAGDIAWDASYIYVCTATDTWKRVGIATW